MSTTFQPMVLSKGQAKTMNPSCFVILADESANWQIAEVRQLDRLFLGINEYADSNGIKGNLSIIVSWDPEVPVEQQWTPHTLDVHEFDSGFVLSTRLLVNRSGLADFISHGPTIHRTTFGQHAKSWKELSKSFELACRQSGAKSGRRWQYLTHVNELSRAEWWLLRHSGKSQDGIVSRFLNRPISAAASYLMLKLSIQPKTWTFASIVLPLGAFFFLLAGTYAGLVAGTAIFQLYSILDGCDGEIARAKYIESRGGAKLDKWCDVFGGFIYAIGLGLGLYHQHSFSPHRWIYVAQAIVCIGLVAVNELRLESSDSSKLESPGLNSILYPRHRELIQHSGILFLGPKLVWWLVNLTKRDLSVLVFLALAITGRPEWILPLWIGTTGAVLLLASIAKVNRKRLAPLGDQPEDNESMDSVFIRP